MFSVAELGPKGLKEHLPLGNNKHEEGQKTLLWLKQRLLLASAIYAPHKSFCHQGGRNIFSQIPYGANSEGGICSLYSYAGHASVNA